jgi:hypothetical protein
MPRISKSVAYEAFDYAAQRMKEAAGNDKITSRKDIKQMLSGTRGVERSFLGYFSAFVDHADYKKGARITAKDIDRRVQYSKDTLVKAYDKNNNGLSNAERARMSRTANLALDFGLELRARNKADRSVDIG